MVAATFDRVSSRAAEIQPLRVLLVLLAAPFYAVGVLVGVVWVAASWVLAAVAEGVADGRRRRRGFPGSDAG